MLDFFYSKKVGLSFFLVYMYAVTSQDVQVRNKCRYMCTSVKLEFIFLINCKMKCFLSQAYFYINTKNVYYELLRSISDNAMMFVITAFFIY